MHCMVNKDVKCDCVSVLVLQSSSNTWSDECNMRGG